MYLMTFGKPRFLGVLESEHKLEKGTHVVISSARGTELAINIGASDPEKIFECRERLLGAPTDSQAKGGEPPFQELAFDRAATAEDLKTREKQEEEEEQILISARKMLRDHKLPMKLVDVEHLLDAKKLFFYFTAEQRIDFRAYVRDLARTFKTRIELRQIGVRDEAKIVKGLSPCGLPCCCSYWLERFDPICIKMVKEQNLALNPAKISGICGRLMCCLAFEHDMYHQLWENLPNPGTKIKTPGGNYVLSGIDIHSKSVRVLHPEKGEILVKVDDFEDFKACVQEGKAWENTRSEKTAEKKIFTEAALETGETSRKDLSCQTDLHEGQKSAERDSGTGRKTKDVESTKAKEATKGTGTAEKEKPRRHTRKKSKHVKPASEASSRGNQQDAQKDAKHDSPEKASAQRKPRRRKVRKKERRSRDKG
ncbi:MAG: regulatory iron-sulfur-containing complex subunit RicT [Thermovirgaceae bacterium]